MIQLSIHSYTHRQLCSWNFILHLNLIFMLGLCSRPLAPHGKHEDGSQASIRCPICFESGGGRETPERRSWHASATTWGSWALWTWFIRAHVSHGAESSWTFLPKSLHGGPRGITRWHRYARCPATSFARSAPRPVACAKGLLTEMYLLDSSVSMFWIQLLRSATI